jgi:hypothetical protein
MSVRAKFTVNRIERCQQMTYIDGKCLSMEVQTIKMSPVSSGSEENKQFFALTPTGILELGTVNADAAKQFELGKSYYIDFTPA